METYQTQKEDFIFPIATSPVFNKQKDEFRQRFRTDEESVFLKSLISCSNTAIILPSYLCKQYVQKIMKSKPSITRHVSFGTEKYFPTYVLFSFDGIVPPFIIRRMKSLYASGLLEWWQGFVRGSDMAAILRTNKQFIAMSIKGNILVVFVVLLVGLTAAWFCFLLEQQLITCVFKKLVVALLFRFQSFLSVASVSVTGFFALIPKVISWCFLKVEFVFGIGVRPFKLK